MAQYRYATDNHNYEDYAAGRVLYNRPGATSFPVRLASEIFQHCASVLPDVRRFKVYDPCCGTGYLLTVLGFLHGDQISSLTGADIDADMTVTTARNLALLTASGLDDRVHQLEALREAYGKESHMEALVSADKLRGQLHPQIKTHVFVADATQPTDDLPQDMHILITDVPYGRSKQWQGDGSVTALLDARRGTLATDSIAAIVTPKGESVQHPSYERVRSFSIGKRQITLLRLASLR